MTRTPTSKLVAFVDEWMHRRINKTRADVLEQVCDELGDRAIDDDRLAARFIAACRHDRF